MAVLLIGCAGPKYRYYFDYYRTAQTSNNTTTAPVINSQLLISSDDLIANASTSGSETHARNIPAAASAPRSGDDRSGGAIASTKQVHSTATPAHGSDQSTLPTNQSASKREISKSDKKEIIHAIKQYRKEMRAKAKDDTLSPPRDQATQKLDNELIVAISFAAVGITLSILGGLGAGFWIAGVIFLGVGVYFFIDWLQKR